VILHEKAGLSSMPIIDHFKILAPFYEKFIPSKYSEDLIKRAGLPVDGLLLDAGGGTGRISKTLKGFVSKVILLDLSFDMLRQAKDHQDIFLINSTTETIPFGDGQFQIILLIDAFHHVLSQEITVRELWRVLKPGGSFIIIEPDVNLTIVKLVALIEKLALMRSHFRKPEDIARLTMKLPKSDVSVIKEQFNAWIIARKQMD
jgi:ubiquinone/menaquinone biosynthesis C-methylase UbiE